MIERSSESVVVTPSGRAKSPRLCPHDDVRAIKSERSCPLGAADRTSLEPLSMSADDPLGTRSEDPCRNPFCSVYCRAGLSPRDVARFLTSSLAMTFVAATRTSAQSATFDIVSIVPSTSMPWTTLPATLPPPRSTSHIWKTSASSAARSTTTSSGRSRDTRGWRLAEACSTGGRVKAPVATGTQASRAHQRRHPVFRRLDAFRRGGAP
jgi:hypothetical protein